MYYGRDFHCLQKILLLKRVVFVRPYLEPS